MSLDSAVRLGNSPIQMPTLQPAERDRLITAHLGKVKFIADRMAARLPSAIERDDLYGWGVIGLLDAVERFEPARGIAFTTFAEMRVRGAILDSLRQLDWASRKIRRQARQVQTAYRELEKKHGRAATDQEVAENLNLPIKSLHELLNQVRGLNICELDAVPQINGRNMLETIFDTGGSPLELYEENELHARLARAVDQLPERERQVIALYYVEELTMREIGEILNVTESRVSQLRSQAVARLRNSFQR